MIARTNRNLKEQRPVDTCPVQYGKQYGAKDSGKDKYELADQHNINFRHVGSLLPVGEVIDRQCHGNETHDNARDDEITQVRSRTYVVFHSKRDLQTQQMHHGTHTQNNLRRQQLCRQWNNHVEQFTRGTAVKWCRGRDLRKTSEDIFV